MQIKICYSSLHLQIKEHLNLIDALAQVGMKFSRNIYKNYYNLGAKKN